MHNSYLPPHKMLVLSPIPINKFSAISLDAVLQAVSFQRSLKIAS